jgi:outer membrane immunogenic protein
VDWLATLRGRLGRAHDRTLYYAHLGLAFAPVHIAIDFPPGFAGTDRWRAGGAAGVGVEHAFSNNLTFKVEWLYIGMELFRCPVGLCDVAATAPDGTDVRVSANILRLGINRKF